MQEAISCHQLFDHPRAIRSDIVAQCSVIGNGMTLESSDLMFKVVLSLAFGSLAITTAVFVSLLYAATR
jgi:hypothetical protein